MMIQETKGKNSPIINGDNNHVNAGDEAKQKVTVKTIAKYTLMGLIIAVATSFIASCIYGLLCGN